MTRQEQGEAHNREAILRAQLEEDLMHVVTLVETESAKWAEAATGSHLESAHRCAR